MTANEVLEVLGWLETAGIEVWVDGGWGVDALLGEETRPHSDLDLALDRDELERARQALEERGFEPDTSSKPGLPARLVMRDARGREVDFHPLIFDHSGDGWQQLSQSGRAWAATRPRISAPRASLRGDQFAVLALSCNCGAAWATSGASATSTTLVG